MPLSFMRAGVEALGVSATNTAKPGFLLSMRWRGVDRAGLFERRPPPSAGDFLDLGLAWQVLDRNARPIGEMRTQAGVPLWSFAAAVPKPNGFVIFFSFAS